MPCTQCDYNWLGTYASFNTQYSCHVKVSRVNVKATGSLLTYTIRLLSHALAYKTVRLSSEMGGVIVRAAIDGYDCAVLRKCHIELKVC